MCATRSTTVLRATLHVVEIILFFSFNAFQINFDGRYLKCEGSKFVLHSDVVHQRVGEWPTTSPFCASNAILPVCHNISEFNKWKFLRIMLFILVLAYLDADYKDQ